MTRESWGSKIKIFLLDNLSYKLVALFVTLILWITIMSRRDFEMTLDIPIETLTSRNVVVHTPRVQKATIRIEGSRSALRHFQKRDKPLLLDLTGRGAGRMVKRVTPDMVSTVDGVRVLQVEPELLEINLLERQSGDDSK